MIISKMTMEDVGFVAELEKECFSMPWSENSLLEEIDNETSLFFVAKEDGKTVGYIGANDVWDEVFITNIAVTREFRRKKVGTALLEKLISVSREKNADCVTLEVRKSNKAAVRLYEQFGFLPVGERKNFYIKPVEDAIIYTLNFKE